MAWPEYLAVLLRALQCHVLHAKQSMNTVQRTLLRSGCLLDGVHSCVRYCGAARAVINKRCLYKAYKHSKSQNFSTPWQRWQLPMHQLLSGSKFPGLLAGQMVYTAVLLMCPP